MSSSIKKTDKGSDGSWCWLPSLRLGVLSERSASGQQGCHACMLQLYPMSQVSRLPQKQSLPFLVCNVMLQRPVEAPFGRSNGFRGHGRYQEQARGSRGGHFRGRAQRAQGGVAGNMPPGFGGTPHATQSVVHALIES